jgi:hypothetical protein
VQYICNERLRADGSKDTQTSSDDESEAEVEEEEEESDDEFCDRTTTPVPKWDGRYWRGTGLCGCSFASNHGGAGEQGAGKKRSETGTQKRTRKRG